MKELESLLHNFFGWFVDTFGATFASHAPGDTFFRNHEPNRIPEMSFSYLQNLPINLAANTNF